MSRIAPRHPRRRSSILLLVALSLTLTGALGWLTFSSASAAFNGKDHQSSANSIGDSLARLAHNSAMAKYFGGFSMMQQAPSCAPPPSGLAHWYPGDGNAFDIQGGTDATLQGYQTGETQFAAGKVSQAFNLNGGSNYVSLGNTVGNFGSSDFSLDFWIQTTSQSREQVLGNRNNDCSGGNYFSVRQNFTPNKLTIEMFGGGSSDIAFTSVRSINDGQFHHIAFVRQSTTLSLYIDGTRDAFGSAQTVATINNTSDFSIGDTSCQQFEVNRFTGQVDELDIFNRALTDTEIQAIVNAGSAGKCKPALGSYATNTSVQLGANTTIAPDAAPTNTTRITASTSTNFKGQLSADPTTGVVRVTDAHPAGTYLVTVTAFGSGGARATKTFMLTVTTPATCGTVNFAAAANFTTDNSPLSVAVGDFNRDSKQDLAVVNQGSGNVSVLLGNGAGGFDAAANFAVGSNPISVAVGDFNGDGKQDLAVANLSSANVSILLGDGAGGFSSATPFATGFGPTAVAVGDFNGDGKQDLAFAAAGNSIAAILLGNGDGSFGAPLPFGANNDSEAIAVGDFNGDGKQDIATANGAFGNNPPNNVVSILLGDGAGGFSAATTFAVGNNPRSVAVGDFNGDGKQDLATANNGSSSVSVLLSDGTGGFTKTDYGVSGNPISVAVGDFNGDGRQDIATTIYGGARVAILLGDVTGGFGTATEFTVGTLPNSVAVGDFNGDGKQDLATANSGTSDVSVLLRQCPPPQVDLSITNTGSPDPVTVNNPLTYTITVQNNPPQASGSPAPSSTPSAQNVIVTDQLPSGVTFNSATSPQGTCSQSNVNATVTCNLGTLASFASASITLNVTPTQAGTLSNTATVSSDNPDSNTADNAATASTNVQPTPTPTPSPAPTADLSLSITDSPDPVTAGNNITYTIPVTNNGSATATNVQLSDTLPTNATYVSINSTQGTCSRDAGNGAFCSIGTLSNGATATVTIVVTATAQGTLTNTVGVSGTEFDPNTANNSATATTTVQAAGDYVFTQSTGAIVHGPTITDSGNHCDDCNTSITLPFGYTLYDQTFPAGASVTVSSNGYLEFIGNTIRSLRDCVPSSNVDHAIVAHWDDLWTTNANTPYTDLGIFTSVSGTAPNRIFNIEWRTAFFYDRNSRTNFEIRLYEGQQRFDIIYGRIDFNGSNAGSGVQRRTGSNFTRYSCLSPSLNAGLMLIATGSASSADLSLTKTGSPSSVTVGDNLTYTVNVANNGPSNATGVSLTDPLPSGVAFVSATSTQGSCTGGGTVVCNVGDLANGATATATIVVRPTAPGTISNTASVTGNQPDFNTSNNSATADTTVVSVTYAISGHVADTSGNSISNATLVLNDGSQRIIANTNADGNYAFNNLTAGGNYTISASKTAYTFSPPSQSFSNLVANQTANFTGTLSTSGSGIYYPSFSSIAGLNLVGNAAQFEDRLRLTPAIGDQRGAAWFTTKQLVQSGFATDFQFRITQPGGDGFTFAIQNSGDGVAALGDTSFGGSGLGYQNIPNSLVVEFDTFGECDGGNQISVHTRGTSPNSADEGFSIGSICGLSIADGNVHTARVRYSPGTMSIFLDDLATPVLTVPVDLATTLSLDNGSAFVGFTAATGGVSENHDILNWAFSSATPAPTPTPSPTPTPTPTPTPVPTPSPSPTPTPSPSPTPTPSPTPSPVPVYTIAGHVTETGSSDGRGGISDAVVTLTNGSQSSTATTDGSGSYTFTNVRGGNYTLSVSRAGYVFSPASRSVTNLSANVVVDFSGAAMAATPAGTNVSVQVGDVELMFANVTQAGTTSATEIDPTTAGPPPRGYALFNTTRADGSHREEKGLNITTTAVFSGTITLKGVFTDNEVSDPAVFAQLRILHGENGVLVDRTILSPDAPAPDFTTRTIYARVSSLSPFVLAVAPPAPPPPPPTFNITGRIVNASNTSVGLTNVGVTLSGANSATTLTDANGNYAFSNLVGNSAYTITPSSNQYGFTPASQTFNNLAANQANVNFAGTQLATPPPPPPAPTTNFDGPLNPAVFVTGTLTTTNFNPNVTVAVANGKLQITPQDGASGSNGIVTANTLDLTVTPSVSIEVDQTTTGDGAQTIFGLGNDANNFYRFVVTDSNSLPPGFTPAATTGSSSAKNGGSVKADSGSGSGGTQTLSFQTNLNGKPFTTGITYNPVEERFWRLRHDAVEQTMNFETSPDAQVWRLRFKSPIAKSVKALVAELAAGTSKAVSNPGVAIFDNLAVVTPVEVEFGAPAYSVVENSGPARITVTRTGTAESAAQVTYATVNGTAVAGTDYTATSGVLTFAVGETTKSFDVALMDKGAAEPDKTLSVTLANAVGAQLGSPSSVVLMILNSTNRTTNVIDDARFFVRQQYLDFLGREPDQSGMEFWTRGITECGRDQRCISARRIDVSAAFFISQEFQETGSFVYRFYKASYGRRPTFSQFTFDRSRVVGGANLEADKQRFATEWVNRAEFHATYDKMTNAEYVDALYANAGVVPSQEERTTLILGLLTGKETRQSVLLKVVGNDEFIGREYNPAFVLMQYFGYLRRDVDEGGYQFWLDVLNNRVANNYRAMVCAFVNSAEYQLRFGTVRTRTDKDCSQ